jgi:hypothetical protein
MTALLARIREWLHQTCTPATILRANRRGSCLLVAGSVKLGIDLERPKGDAMPHHWRPADGGEPTQERKKLKFHGTDKDGESWELWEITVVEAKEIEKKPKKHDCERVLY